jgi:hypothetical protein
MIDDPGVPLSHYLAHDGCSVRFHCLECQTGFDVPVGAVIERLKMRGLGDEHTGVWEVARRAQRACGRCGARRWETRPSFPMR